LKITAAMEKPPLQVFRRAGSIYFINSEN